jgi:hypothetical protein
MDKGVGWAQNPEVVGSNPTPATGRGGKGSLVISVVEAVCGVIFGLRPKITPTSTTHPSDSRRPVEKTSEEVPFFV